MKRIFTIMIAFMVALAASACGGGGSTSTSGGTTDDGTTTASTDIDGLAIATQLSIVSDNSSTASSALSQALRRGGQLSLLPTSGEYVTDPVESFVYDSSLEAFEFVNIIACFFSQTAYADMTNEGAYSAMVNATRCEGNREDKSGDDSNQSSAAGGTVEFETWIVNSERECEDADCPQTVTFWIPEEDGAEIRVQLVVTEAASEENPFGLFTMQYEMYQDDEPVGSGGYVTMGETDVGFYEMQMDMDEDGFSQRVHAIMTPGNDDPTSEGVAWISRSMSGGAMGGGGEGEDGEDGGASGESFEELIEIAFNAEHYKATYNDGEWESCVSRTDYVENVWRYNLYDADGARVSRNSGFGIKCGDDEHAYGWAGYYGIWCDDRFEVGNGSTVTSQDGDTTYTVYEAPGRLIRKTRNTIAISELDGELFSYWEFDQESGTGVNYRSRLDVTDAGVSIMKIGTEICNENGCSQEDISPEQEVALEPFMWIGLWKQGFGSLDLVVGENGEISPDSDVPYYEEEFVKPNDAVFANGDLTLKSYENCLLANVSADDWNAGNVSDSSDDLLDPCVFTISGDDMTLKRDGVAVGLADGATIDEFGSNGWGAWSGAMVPSTIELDETWDIWNQDVIYHYETGPNAWNHYTALLDSNGAPLDFDAPLQCLYQDSEEGTFVLDYSGEGELHGIPYHQLEVSENSSFEQWVAAFIIPDGSELNCGGTTYYSKAMTVEKFMAAEESSACNDLATGNVGEPLFEPEEVTFEDAPTISDAPAVVEGTVQ